MWEIDIDVAPGNPDPGTGKNDGGIIIYLVQDGANYIEMCRVQFIRRNSKNPKTGFIPVLKKKLGEATAAKNALNKIDIDIEEVQDRLDDLIDRAEAARADALAPVKEQGAV